MKNWVMLLMVGLLSIIGGAFAVISPEIAGVSVSFLIAAGIILLGVLAVFFGFSAPSGAGVIWSIILGVIMIVIGALMFRNPMESLAALNVIVAVLTLTSGIIMLLAAFTVDMGGSRWWSVIGGVASVVLAYFLFTEPASLGILIGFQLIFYGFSLVGLAFAARRVNSIYY